MTVPWLLMTYDRDAERWMVHLDGGRYPMHCGECLEIRVTDDVGMTCRLELELDREWYVITEESRFYLRKKDTYQIHI